MRWADRSGAVHLDRGLFGDRHVDLAVIAVEDIARVDQRDLLGAIGGESTVGMPNNRFGRPVKSAPRVAAIRAAVRGRRTNTGLVPVVVRAAIRSVQIGSHLRRRRARAHDRRRAIGDGGRPHVRRERDRVRQELRVEVGADPAITVSRTVRSLDGSPRRSNSFDITTITPALNASCVKVSTRSPRPASRGPRQSTRRRCRCQSRAEFWRETACGENGSRARRECCCL